MDDGAVKHGEIGSSVSRPGARRAVLGRGCYLDDVRVADIAHVVFLRSPHSHARILQMDLAAALAAPGVIACFSGSDVASVCKPCVTALARVPSHRSAPQYPIAPTEACWQGEAVAAIVAESRAEAEDALELIDISWEALPATADIDTALEKGAPLVHSSLPDNLAIDHVISTGDVDKAFAEAAAVVEHTFEFGRQTGVSLEPRGIVASFNHGTGELTVHQSHQSPFLTRDAFAQQLGLDPSRVRVIVPDVGGAFGVKLHVYADELAVAAISMLVDRPVKFVADRLEAFLSDIHAREAKVKGRLAVSGQGQILGFDIDLVSAFGAYSIFPRTSIGEAMQAIQIVGAPYECQVYRGRARGVYQNKVPTGAYRGVGHPLACAITEQLVDLGAAAVGIDPADFRRLNHRRTSDQASTTAGGLVIRELSLDECLATLRKMMDYDCLRAEQTALRKRGIYRGIGLSVFVEQTGVGHYLYGSQNIPVTAQESCRLELEPSGTVRCSVSATDQGQGTLTGLAQIVASELGVPFDSVHLVSGDTAMTPHGGGAFASRGITLGGEAALRACRQLKGEILKVAAAMLQGRSTEFDIVDGMIVGLSGGPRMGLSEIAYAVRFSPASIALDRVPALVAEESYAPASLPYVVANGIQAAHVEVDVGTGIIKVLGYWVVDDCGRIINPQLVDEQIRGGVVQGIGAALFEHCVYSPEGQLLNGNLADYLLPMASEMPDIDVAHVSRPTQDTLLGSKGVGEAGTVGALGAMWTAVNDAIRPLDAQVTRQPFTPDHILDKLIEAEQHRSV